MSPEVLDTLGRAMHGVGWVFFLVLLLPLLYLFAPSLRGLKPLVETIISTIDTLNYHIGETVKWGLVLLVLSVAMSVFALSIFGLSWTKLSESAEYFHASVLILGASATLLASQHVRVDIFHSQMSAKSKALVDFIGFYALLLPVCLIILWNSQSFIYFSWLIFEGSSESDGIRGEFLLKSLIPAFSVLMISQGFAIALRAAMCLHGQNRPQRPEHTPPLYRGSEHVQALQSATQSQSLKTEPSR